MLMSCLDVLDDWFENDLVKAFLARYVSEVIVGPDDVGTGSFLFDHGPACARIRHGRARGRVRALSQALARHHRKWRTIRTGATVTGITLSGGRATGVTLESGETLSASRAVIADLNIGRSPSCLVMAPWTRPSSVR